MISRTYQHLCSTEGVERYPGIRRGQAESLARDVGVRFPSDYLQFLQMSNGLQSFRGFFRIFGLGTVSRIDAVRWNARDFWKFAWEDRCSGYWCFGETAWGDQYAFSINDLTRSGASSVLLLDAESMTPEPIAGSFSEFLEREFLRNARRPYDEMTIKAREKIGAIELESHVAYMPPLLVGGTEEVSNILKMNARASMVCHGDIARQVDEAPDEKVFVGIETYEDGQQRQRIRLIWR